MAPQWEDDTWPQVRRPPGGRSSQDGSRPSPVLEGSIKVSAFKGCLKDSRAIRTLLSETHTWHISDYFYPPSLKRPTTHTSAANGVFMQRSCIFCSRCMKATHVSSITFLPRVKWHTSRATIGSRRYSLDLDSGFLRLPALCSYSWKGMSWNSMVGKYMLFTTDVDLTRKVLNQNSKDTLLMAVRRSCLTFPSIANLDEQSMFSRCLTQSCPTEE